MMKSIQFHIVFFAVLAAVVVASGAEASSRSTGMGGARIAVPDPALLGRDNPAVLGVMAPRGFRLNVFDISATGGNSAFGVQDYVRYNGAVLTEADEDEILSRLGDGGLEISGGARGYGPGFGFGPFAFSARAIGAAGGRVPKSVLELVFDGNSLDEPADFSAAAGGGWAAIEGALAYGHPLDDLITGGETTAGLRARYLYGLYVAQVTHASGRVVTTIDTLYGTGRLDLRTATGGTGYALDAGLLHRRGDLNLGFRLVGLWSKMTWDSETEITTFTVDAGVGDIFDDDSEMPEPETTEETVATTAFSSRLPLRIGLGAGYPVGPAIVAADIEHTPLGLAVGEDPWRVSSGAEFLLLGGHIRPRVGAMIGSTAGKSLTGGLSFLLGPFRLDLDAGTSGSFNPFSPRGLQVAAGSSLVLG